MKKKLVLIAATISLVLFLSWPSFSYVNIGPQCPYNPYANCSASYSREGVQLFGGIRYLTRSFSVGSFVLSGEVLVQNVITDHGGYSDEHDRYFRPDWAILGSLIIGVLVAYIYSKYHQRKKTR